MKSDKKIVFYSIVLVVVLILVAVGVTYAYFENRINSDSGVKVTTETTSETKVTYTTGDSVDLINVEPGAKKELLFNIALTASNKTDDSVVYGIDWVIESNNFVYEPENPEDPQLVYSLYYSEDNVNWIEHTVEKDCTTLSDTSTIAKDLSLTAETNQTKTVYWKMVVEYKAYDYNQATNMSKNFTGYLEVTGLN